MDSKDRIKKAIEKLSKIKGIKFKDLEKICDEFFKKGAGKKGSSHKVYKTPWIGDPRINIQKMGKEAKPYQVKQVITALAKLMEKGEGNEH